MEKTIIYTILLVSMVFPLVQLFLSMNYFKKFAFEYLDNLPSSWNPNYDRKILVFNIILTSGSLILGRAIWTGQTNDSWFSTLLCLAGIILFFLFIPLINNTLQKESKNSDYQIINYEKYENPIAADLYNLLISSNRIKISSVETDILAIINKTSPKNQIIWTGKYNNVLSYIDLIILYKFILKEEDFNIKWVYKKIHKSFLFESRDSNTGDMIIKEVNYKSFCNAFCALDFDHLKQYQQVTYNEYLKIFK